MAEKKCLVCGKTFNSSRAFREICSEVCRAERKKKYWGKERGMVSAIRKPKVNAGLVSDAAAARKAGMTYGQYKGSGYSARHPLVRKW